MLRNVILFYILTKTEMTGCSSVYEVNVSNKLRKIFYVKQPPPFIFYLRDEELVVNSSVWKGDWIENEIDGDNKG
jgi:hypothetical protein